MGNLLVDKEELECALEQVANGNETVESTLQRLDSMEPVGFAPTEETLRSMLTYGSIFERAIAFCYRTAGENERKLLLKVFPRNFVKYGAKSIYQLRHHS